MLNHCTLADMDSSREESIRFWRMMFQVKKRFSLLNAFTKITRILFVTLHFVTAKDAVVGTILEF